MEIRKHLGVLVASLLGANTFFVQQFFGKTLIAPFFSILFLAVFFLVASDSRKQSNLWERLPAPLVLYFVSALAIFLFSGVHIYFVLNLIQGVVCLILLLSIVDSWDLLKLYFAYVVSLNFVIYVFLALNIVHNPSLLSSSEENFALIETVRYVGLYGSPGSAVVYFSAAFTIFFGSLCFGLGDKKTIIFAFFSFLLCMLTGNRSALLLCILSIIIFLFILLLNSRSKTLSSRLFFIMISLFISYFPLENRIQQVYQRFSEEGLENRFSSDKNVGIGFFFDHIQGLSIDDLFFGFLSVDPGGLLLIKIGDTIYSPHTGLIYDFCVYGLITFVFLVIFVGASLRSALFCLSKTCNSLARDSNREAVIVSVSICLLFVLSFSEPFLLTSLFAYFAITLKSLYSPTSYSLNLP